MARRQLIVAQVSPGRHVPTSVRVHVDDHTPVGPWVATLAGHLGYPLVDTFGKPITYRLRCLSSEQVLLTTGRFADAHFSSGSQFVLEPDLHQTQPIQPEAYEPGAAHHSASTFPQLSRRQILHTGMLGTVSLFGLGTGATTAFAQHILTHKGAASSPVQATPASFGISLQTQFTQHQQAVRAVSWSPDEQMLLSGGDDTHALVWQLDGTLLHALSFKAPVQALAWSPDGMQFAVGAHTTVVFFDAQTTTLLAQKAHQHTAPITALGWTEGASSASLLVSAGADKTAIVWDGQSHLPRVVFRRHTTAIEALALLADTAVTVSEGGVARVWNILSGQEVHGYYADTQQALRAVALSSAGALAMGGDDGIVSLWSDGRTCIHQVQDAFGVRCIDAPAHLQGHTHSVHAVAFSPDGALLATGGEDKHLILWSTATREPLFKESQQETLTALAWSPSGQFLAGVLGTRIVIWRLHH